MTIRVSMFGPVPEPWGGKAAGGGVATHVQGLVTGLPLFGVAVRLLADNTDAAQHPPLPAGNGLFVAPMIRPGGGTFLRDVFRLGIGRGARIGWKMLSHPPLRQAAPFSRQIKLLGQAANYDRFLQAGATDLIHVHHAEYRQFICQQILGVELPLVATVHSVTVLIRDTPSWLKTLTRENYRQASRLIAVSNFVRDAIVREGADPAKICVIPNGVDIKRFSPASPSIQIPVDRSGGARFHVLFVGKLNRWKGLDVLLRAFKLSAISGSRLMVIGEGPEKARLTRLASELGIAAIVEFAGYKPLSELPAWYRACDVFVLPSHSEGLSVSVLEAMACGKPVITSRPVIGLHDAVQDGKTGLLTDFGDVGQLAQALRQLAAHPHLRERMGAAARQRVEGNFGWEVVLRRTVEVYRVLWRERDSGHG